MKQNQLLQSFKDNIKTAPLIKQVTTGTKAGGREFLMFQLLDGFEITVYGDFELEVRVHKDEIHFLRTCDDRCSRLVDYRVIVDRWPDKEVQS